MPEQLDLALVLRTLASQPNALVILSNLVQNQNMLVVMAAEQAGRPTFSNSN